MSVTVGNPCGTPLLSQLERAKNGLEDAQISLCGAFTAHAEAKRVLELGEAVALCAGVEGRNDRERSAKLRLELRSECAALAEAEDALIEARCAFEVAKLEWDLARYSLRVMEVGQLREAA